MLNSNEENKMTRYSCEDFVFKLASNTPVPGGGGASALVGAIGMAFEKAMGQNQAQGWEFYAITAALFLTLAFPGFVYRYLLRRGR